MISYITGKIRSVHGNQLVVDVGFVGLEITVAQAATLHEGATAALYAYMHWNQEQGPTLFGFETELDKAIFLLIIGCSGIGPKLGMAVLAQMGAKNFLDAIQSGNDKALSKVSGIGGKKAEQLVIQLRDKVSKLLKSGVDVGDSGSLQEWQTVADTLTSLNYTRTEVAAAMKHLGDTYAGAQISFDQLLRTALTYLAKKG